MSVAYRADDHPVKSRVDYWTHVVDEVLCPFGVRVPGGAGFRNTLKLGDLGAVRVADMAFSQPGTATRSVKHVRRDDAHLCKIDIQARGHTVISQGDHVARQGPGQVTFVDLSRPCRWEHTTAAIIAVVFPRALLPFSPDEVARLAGVCLDGTGGFGGLVANLGRQLPAHLDVCSELHRARLGTVVLDMIAVALATRLDRLGHLTSDTRRRALLQAVYIHVEEHLSDPELSPRSIAAAHHLSVRSLHKLFEPEETTVADWIRRRRLERSRHDLLDPAMRTVPVGAIAARRGITDPAYFSRLFRATYGMSPVECRRLTTAV